MSITYKESIDAQRTARLRAIIQELPIACSDFFSTISQTTQVLTRLAYAYDFRIFFHYLYKENPVFSENIPKFYTDKELKLITARDIVGFQDYLLLYYKDDDLDAIQMIRRNRELGVMRKLSAVRSLFDYLFKFGHIDANVSTLVDLPVIHEKPILRLDHNEMQKLIHVAGTGDGLSDHQKKYQERTRLRDTAMLLLFLGTGIRVSECVGTNIDDFDFDLNAFLVTRKGGDQTILYFPETVAEALQQYLQERRTMKALPGHEQAFFLSLQRKRITQRAVQNLVKKYAAIAAPLKKRISPHKLRSTFGTNLYQETGDIYLVADVLGHSDVNTTRRHYAAMTDQRRREASKHIPLPKPDAATEEEDENVLNDIVQSPAPSATES